LVDSFRIENAFECGGSVHDCMRNESDALVLTRVAMGEAPNSFDDRVYVMWNIRLRAELGFKLAGHYAGQNELPLAWGPPTSIKHEALCNGGCQYSPARAAQEIYFGCELEDRSSMRAMVCPTDEDVIEFYMTFVAAQQILEKPLSEFPPELRGYDGFRSPQVTWMGTIDRQGGLASRRFFEHGNIWRDEYPKDNRFWDAVAEGRIELDQGLIERHEPTPTAMPTPTATPVPTATGGPDTALADRLQNLEESAIVGAEPDEHVEEEGSEMKAGKWRVVTFGLAAVLLSFMLMAFQSEGELPARVEEIIAGIISFLVILLGPKPLKALFDALKIPGGAWRMIATYVVAAIIGAIALLVAGAISGVPTTIEEVMALAGLLVTAVSAAYHRLKDQGRI